MKKKKNGLKRVLLIAVIVILAFIAVRICITEIYAHKLSYRYASAEEGKELLLANTEYYDSLTRQDIDYRMQKRGATKEELLKASTDEIKSFNLFEKYLMDRFLAKMAKTLSKNGYELPQLKEVVYIKSDMSVEGGNSGYTHRNEIYLNSANIMFSWIPGASDFFQNMMWHELFHCLSRNNPDFRAEMYSLINFTVADSDFELPPCVRDKYFSNPDVEHHDAYATFMIDGKETDCFLVWICREDYPEEGGAFGFNNEAVLVPIDGTDIYYTREQASNFDEVFGTNTSYVIDPEECMADNFADAMQYGLAGRNGQGYPNPEIIEGIINRLHGMEIVIPKKESVPKKEEIGEQQALEAVKNYCFKNNPDLEDMIDSEDYTAYFDVSTNEAGEIVVLFRSYTGAQIRYYVDPASGEVYVTELVPGIIDDEQRTDESFNIKDYQ